MHDKFRIIWNIFCSCRAPKAVQVDLKTQKLARLALATLQQISNSFLDFSTILQNLQQFSHTEKS